MQQLWPASPDMRLLSHALASCVIGVVIADAQHEDFPIVYVNPAFERLSGYSADEIVGRNCRFLQGEDRDQPARHEIHQAYEHGRGLTTVLRNYRKDGTMFYNELTLSPIHDAAGTLTHYLGFQNDVTARELALRSEVQAREQLATTLSRMTDGFMSFDRDWNFTYINEAAASISGRSPQDFIGHNLLTSFPEYKDLAVGQATQQAALMGLTQSAVSYMPPFDRWVELTAYPSGDGLSLFTRDVTESQRVMRERQISEERFSKVFETSPVAIFITRRRDRHLLDVNSEFLRQSGYSREEVIGRSSQDLGLWVQQGDREFAWSMLDGEQPLRDREIWFRNKLGNEIYGVLSIIPMEIAGEACVIGFVHDITREQQAKQQLENSEQYARQMAAELQRTLDLSLDIVTTIGPGAEVLSVNAACERILGYTPEELIGRSYLDFVHPDDREKTQMEAERVRQRHATTIFENRFLRKDGEVVCIEWNAVTVPGEDMMYCVARDVTQRRAAEEDRSFLAAIVQASGNAIIGLSLDDTIRSWNASAQELYGYTAEEAVGQSMLILIPPELQDEELRIFEQVVQGEQIKSYESVRVTQTGERLLVMTTVAAVLNADGDVIGASRISQDIRALKAAEHQIQQLNKDLQQQLRHVNSLREIDQSIASSADLTITLGLVLDNIRQELEIDVATVLLLDPHQQTLTYAVTRGFYATKLEASTVRLGTGLAGRVGRSRQPLSLPELTGTSVLPAWREMLRNEGLTSYYAAPLLMKGQVLGVIEVLHHQAWMLSPEWLMTFETLIGQAAIAVDNARLVEELERSNAELRLAYDATIEGWAGALDLRDKETEGHSRRVTEMTVELCQTLGFTPEQLVNVRRGALLHDIGKMGIPDAILLKPGKLTDEEWVEMKQHPSHAVKLLSPITFLRPALEIPEAHHEKWDGSGYPYGLIGTAIPLSCQGVRSGGRLRCPDQ